MSEVDTTVPNMDHSAADLDNGPTEAELLDAVLASSPIMDEIGESLPVEEVPEVDPVESDEEVDPEESEEIVSDEEYEEEVEEDEVEDAAEEAATGSDVFTADDLDLDAKVTVKVDGEDMDVSFADLLKGYQTDASLSKKGRELGEARKAIEEERNAALAQVQEIGAASAAVLMSSEQNLAKEYHAIEEKISKAREEGDTYEVNELKDKREQVQQKYWAARKNREGLQGKLAEQKQAQEQANWQKQMEYFSANIEDHVPGFDAEMAGDIREFAIAEGIPEAMIDSVMDPAVVKFINEYRVLKQGVKKGEAKRKAVPAKKAVPTKKARSEAQKRASRENLKKARAMSPDSSKDEQDAWLKAFAANSLSNL